MANNGVNWTSAPVVLFNNFEKDIESILVLLFQVSTGYSGRICEDSLRDLTLVIDCLWGVRTRCHSTGEYNPLVDVQPESHDQHDNYLRQQVEAIDEIMQGDFEGSSILPTSPLAFGVELFPESDHMSQSNDIKPSPESDHTQSSNLGHSPGSDHTQNSDLGSPVGDQGPTTPQLPSDKGFCCMYPGCTSQKPFKYLSKLKDHIRKHQPASIQCPECKQMFKQERILKKHLLRIHKSTDKNQKAVKNTCTASSQMQPQDHQSPSPDTSLITLMGWDQNNMELGGIILLEGSSSIDHHWVPTYNSCGLLFGQE